MFNHFTIEGDVIDAVQHLAKSGATKQIITLEIDSSYMNKKTGCMVEKTAHLKLKNYVTDGMPVEIGEYIIATGKIYVSIDTATGQGYPTFVIESHVAV